MPERLNACRVTPIGLCGRCHRATNRSGATARTLVAAIARIAAVLSFQS